jgi:hypothetical protein
MFLAIQFPFADARSFLDDGGGRLSRPSWPLVSPGRDFVRASGLVRPRRRGGVSDWAGEEIYGDAKRALRFEDRLGAKHFTVGASSHRLKCAFRRFHSQGIVARLEIGLSLNVDSTEADCELLPLIRDLLKLSVTVPDGATRPDKAASSYLGESGARLAKHFLAATTDRKRDPPAEKPAPWWFSCGNLGLVVEFDGIAKLPPHTRHVMQVPDADASLFHTWIDFAKQRCSVWFIRDCHGDREAARRLRIHLTRLHCERECLKNILLYAKGGGKQALEKGGPSSDQIQIYLRDAVNLLQRPQFMGFQQSKMLDAAREALGTAFEGETASLEAMRRQICSLVDGYVRRAQNTATVINNIGGDYMSANIQMGNVTVSGDFNVVTATNIQNSFNKAANSGVSDELKTKLKDLSVEVAGLAKALPPDDAEKASKDLEVLTSEAVSKKPRKEWYELSAKGLMEAAKTVAGMAAPVTTAVKAILALIAG